MRYRPKLLRRLELVGSEQRKATLFLGDCREIIPELKAIDTVVTDPPYGIEELVVGYGRKLKKIIGDSSLDLCTDVLRMLCKQLTDAWVLSFYSCRISPLFFAATQGLPYAGEFIWDKKSPGLRRGSGFKYQHENIAIFRVGDPPKMARCLSLLACYRAGSRDGSGLHPHEKPEALMERLLLPLPGTRVLDPFMGTGTTGVAAVRLGRDFVGIEIDPTYFEIAHDRIKAALFQRTLRESLLQKRSAKPDKPGALRMF